MITETQMRNQIFRQIQNIPLSNLRELSEYVENLVKKKTNINKDKLIKFAGIIDKEELLLMQLAIEQGCEKIDHNEW